MTIYQALSSLSYPVCHPPYEGDATTYITYQLLGQDSQIYAEGKEAATATTYAVNLYGSAFSGTVLQTVKSALETAGYIVVVEAESYDDKKRLTMVALTATIEGAVYG